MQQLEVRALEYDPSSRSRRRVTIFLACYISSPVFGDATDDRMADDG